MRHEGNVKHLRLDRGFGFLTDDEGRDLFFHVSSLSGGLEWDETLVERRITFERVATDRGVRAVNVRPEQ